MLKRVPPFACAGDGAGPSDRVGVGVGDAPRLPSINTKRAAAEMSEVDNDTIKEEADDTPSGPAFDLSSGKGVAAAAALAVKQSRKLVEEVRAFLARGRPFLFPNEVTFTCDFADLCWQQTSDFNTSF